MPPICAKIRPSKKPIWGCSAMGQTLAEKILARASGRASVRPGEIVTCRVDLAMMHDFERAAARGPDPAAVGRQAVGPDQDRHQHRPFRAGVRCRNGGDPRPDPQMGEGGGDREFLRHAGDLPHHPAGARASEARHVRGRRGLAFADRRCVRLLHVRHRRDRDGRRSGDRRDLGEGAGDASACAGAGGSARGSSPRTSC